MGVYALDEQSVSAGAWSFCDLETQSLVKYSKAASNLQNC
jgi:hypothetical protein